MAKKPASTPGHWVVLGAFEEFLKRLSSDPTISPQVVDQLRKTLLEKQDLTPDGLRIALFPENLTT